MEAEHVMAWGGGKTKQLLDRLQLWNKLMSHPKLRTLGPPRVEVQRRGMASQTRSSSVVISTGAGISMATSCAALWGKRPSCRVKKGVAGPTVEQEGVSRSQLPYQQGSWQEYSWPAADKMIWANFQDSMTDKTMATSFGTCMNKDCCSLFRNKCQVYILQVQKSKQLLYQ